MEGGVMLVGRGNGCCNALGLVLVTMLGVYVIKAD